MYWHFETDIISAVILVIILIEARGQFDRTQVQNKVFLICLYIGIVSSCLDIIDAVMPAASDPAVLLFSRTLYYAGICMPIHAWLCYTISIIFENDSLNRLRWFKITGAIYGAYFIFLIINVFTGIAFYYDRAGGYHHGVLYPVPMALAIFVSVLCFLLMFINRKKVHEKRIMRYLLALPFGLLIGMTIELLMQGWLMVNTCYMIMIFIAYSFIQNKTNQNIITHLEDEADTDSLTGLYNRIGAEKRIEGYLGEKHESLCSALIIADMDDLKQVNDTLGHLAGDAALKMIADIFKARFRSTDIIGRLGGDEFIIFLHRIPDEQTLRGIIEDVIAHFEGRTVGDHVKLPVHCSFGAVTISGAAESYASLYACADKALYQIKKQKKNDYMIINFTD